MIRCIRYILLHLLYDVLLSLERSYKRSLRESIRDILVSSSLEACVADPQHLLIFFLNAEALNMKSFSKCSRKTMTVAKNSRVIEVCNRDVKSSYWIANKLELKARLPFHALIVRL